jgi:hypothetical protein
MPWMWLAGSPPSGRTMAPLASVYSAGCTLMKLGVSEMLGADNRGVDRDMVPAPLPLPGVGFRRCPDNGGEIIVRAERRPPSPLLPSCAATTSSAFHPALNLAQVATDWYALTEGNWWLLFK